MSNQEKKEMKTEEEGEVIASGDIDLDLSKLQKDWFSIS